MPKYTCFVISPIGEEGTEVHEEYQDLFDLIIKPALEIYDMDVRRGDHFVNEGRIDDSVIKNVQMADICICDISMPNVNVYYELGRRDETGKPVLLLKRRGTDPSPVDIATRRYFEYDWEGRRAIREAQDHIRSFVEPLIEQGFEQAGKSATIGDLAETLARMERKIDRMAERRVGDRPPSTSTALDLDGAGTDPLRRLQVALIQRNVPLAEEAMGQLRYRMGTVQFYDQVVEVVSGIGSLAAGVMLAEFADEFFDTDATFKQKVDYLGCLVGYANRTDREQDVLDLVLRLCDRLDAAAGGEDPELVAQIDNQKNRLYNGLYTNTEDTAWLDKAIACLEHAMTVCPCGFLHYNLAVCRLQYGEATGEGRHFELAREAVDACLADDGDEVDADHLELACKIYARLNDERFDDVFERLGAVDQARAFLLERQL